jgi:hypothetical protein
MAAQIRVSITEQHQRAFDMRSLVRLATWGTAATVALVVAVAASYSTPGSRRLAAAAGQAPSAQAAMRSPEAEAETRRLADAVRVLTADRERLVARIGTLERNLEDMTGSIRRERATPSAEPAAPPSPAAASAAPAPPPDAAKLAAVPAPSEPQAAGSPGQPHVPAPSGEPREQPREQAVAAAPPAAADHAPEPRKPEFGVDVGGAVNHEGLRVLWASTKGNHAALFEGLHPVVAVRENSRTKSREFRLIAGPIANLEAATRLCATLSTSRRYCQPVGFEGQRLADADTTTERKPAAATKPAPKQPPAASKLPRLFQ